MPLLRIRETLGMSESGWEGAGDRSGVLEARGRWLRPEVLTQVLPRVPGARNRKLNAMTTLVLCVALNLWRQEEASWVFRELVSGVRWLVSAADARITRGGVSRARSRLGAGPLIALFRAVCRPLATPQTLGAFRFGRRVMATDNTVFDLADTPANVEWFGRPRNQYTPGAWPQAQLTALCECGTHAICDAEFAPMRADPRAMARQLVRSITPEMLVMLDQGLYSFDLFAAIRARQADLLVRVLPYVKPTPVRTLADGTQVVRIAPSADGRQRAGEHMLLRLIRSTIDDPGRAGHGIEHRLLTSLLDPAIAPALELILTYHERWEIELTIDEVATHQLTPIPMRSKRPEGVIQELYALLLAHFIVRTLMVEAAASAPAPLAPTHLSFLGSLRLLREALPDFQRYHAQAHPTIHARLLADLAAVILPPRAQRANPRVVKQRCSPFPTKRPVHTRWPQPTKPFPQAIVLLLSPSTSIRLDASSLPARPTHVLPTPRSPCARQAARPSARRPPLGPPCTAPRARQLLPRLEA